MSAFDHIASIDLGYHSTKYGWGNVIDGLPEHIQSFASRAEPPREEISGQDLLNPRRNSVRVPIGRQVFEVVTDGMTVDSSHEPVLNKDFVRSTVYHALFKAALIKIGKSHIHTMVMGLPVDATKAAKDQVRQMAAGTHDLGEHGSCHVEHIELVSQGLGAFRAYIFDVANSRQMQRIDELKTGTLLIVDVGHFTLDWIVIESRHPNPRRSGSSAHGVSAILRAAARAIADEVDGEPPTIAQMNAALQSKTQSLKIRGRSTPLQPFVDRAGVVIEQGINALLNAVMDTSYLDEVILCGGGAPYYRAHLQRLLGRPIHVMSDPAHANVRGYQMLAVAVNHRRMELARA